MYSCCIHWSTVHSRIHLISRLSPYIHVMLCPCYMNLFMLHSFIYSICPCYPCYYQFLSVYPLNIHVHLLRRRCFRSIFHPAFGHHGCRGQDGAAPLWGRRLAFAALHGGGGDPLSAVCGSLVSLENLGTILSQNHDFPQSDCGFLVYLYIDFPCF